MRTLTTPCFCDRRGLLVLGLPVLSLLCQDCNDGLQKNKKGRKAPAATARNGSIRYSWLERTALLSTVAVCVYEPS